MRFKNFLFISILFLILFLTGQYAFATSVPEISKSNVPIIAEDELGSPISNFVVYVNVTFPNTPIYDYNYEVSIIDSMPSTLGFAGCSDSDFCLYSLYAKSNNLESGIVSFNNSYYYQNIREALNKTQDYPFKIIFVLSENKKIEPKIIETAIGIDKNLEDDTSVLNYKNQLLAIGLIIIVLVLIFFIKKYKTALGLLN